MAEALLALGANVGDVRATLERAVEMLCDGDLVRLRARSSDYRTPPWGVEQQPEFVNLCIAVETNLCRAACWSVHSKSKARSGATVPAKRTGGRGQRHRSPRLHDIAASEPGSSSRIRTCSNGPRARAARRDCTQPDDCRPTRTRRTRRHRHDRHQEVAAAAQRIGLNPDPGWSQAHPWHFRCMTDPISSSARLRIRAGLARSDGASSSKVLKGAPFDRKLGRQNL